jgi:hypothetical protein
MPAEYTPQVIADHFRQTNERLRRIEEQLARLSESTGVPYERPLAEIPEDVQELARSGKSLEAMKLYRELTNASAEDARKVIAGL